MWLCSLQPVTVTMLVILAQGRLLKFFSLTDIRVSTVDRFIETSQLIGESRSKRRRRAGEQRKKDRYNCFGFVWLFSAKVLGKHQFRLEGKRMFSV